MNKAGAILWAQWLTVRHTYPRAGATWTEERRQHQAEKMRLYWQRRRGDVPDTKARQQQLRHRADIDSAARRIACDRQQRLLFEMKFVIVIVFDHRETELARKIEEPQAALRRQRYRRRELVVWRQVKRADLVFAA